MEHTPLTRETAIGSILQHFNEPVLFGSTLARLVGFGEDEDDFYYICIEIGGRVVWYSMAAGFISLTRLKGQDLVISHNGEEWDDFHRLDKLLSYNGAPKADAPVITTSTDSRTPSSEPKTSTTLP